VERLKTIFNSDFQQRQIEALTLDFVMPSQWLWRAFEHKEVMESVLLPDSVGWVRKTAFSVNGVGQFKNAYGRAIMDEFSVFKEYTNRTDQAAKNRCAATFKELKDSFGGVMQASKSITMDLRTFRERLNILTARETEGLQATQREILDIRSRLDAMQVG
jgi:hypothetical protein